MKSFTYTIQDAVGIHARPAGLLVKNARNYKSEITLEKDGKVISATKLMAIMGLSVKCGDTVTVRISGEDEDDAAEAMQRFFREHL